MKNVPDERHEGWEQATAIRHTPKLIRTPHASPHLKLVCVANDVFSQYATDLADVHRRTLQVDGNRSLARVRRAP